VSFVAFIILAINISINVPT